MISELCNKHGQSNPSPRCRTAADQVPWSLHEVFAASIAVVAMNLFDNKMIHEIKYNEGKNLDNYWP